jgi:RNA polymerase sigma-70 factor, ECF subfamily
MTEKEFADIINSTKKIVLSAIEKNLFSKFYHSIDDVAQETYLRAYKNLIKNKFRNDSSISTWLYTIARNESLRMNKKLFREEEKAAKIFEKNKRTEPGNDDDKNEIIKLKDSINELPGKYKEVLLLIADGMSIKEISFKLRIKEGTVKSRTHRGKQILSQLRTGGK